MSQCYVGCLFDYVRTWLSCKVEGTLGCAMLIEFLMSFNIQKFYFLPTESMCVF